MINKVHSFSRFLLIGHPNVGKSHLFNQLTKISAATGNRAGVTIDKQAGAINGSPDKVLEDLPGIYYLEQDYQSCALDQQVTLKRLAQSSEQDLLINVLDARTLRPQLHLTLQLIELRKPMILIITFCDDPVLAQELKNLLGVPTLLSKDLNEKTFWSSLTATCGIVQHIPSHPEIAAFFSKRESSRDPFTEKDYTLSFSDTTWAFLEGYAQTDRESILSTLRYQFIDRCLQKMSSSSSQNSSWGDHIDSITLHRFFGLPLFFAVMFFIFYITIVGGGLISDFLVSFLPSELSALSLPPFAERIFFGSLLGVETVVSFIPPLGILYMSLGILEQSGYMQRAALVVDRFMQYLHLPGQSLVPIIVGLGCNVPAIFSARTLTDPVDRLQTMLMSPFMTCSARLAIFTVFSQAFFSGRAYYAIFGLYLLGFAIAILTGLAIRFVFQKSEPSPLIMPYVAYQKPLLKPLIYATLSKLKDFCFKAIQSIIPAIILLHLFVDHDEIARNFFRPIMFIFEPMGLCQNNWPAVLSLFSGLIAKEVLLGTLQGSYQVADGNLLELTHYFQNSYAAMSYLIFVLLYFPCVSVSFAIAKESHMFWAIFSAIWSTSLAYCCSILYYQWSIGEWPLFTLLIVTTLCLFYLLSIILFVKHRLVTDIKRTIPFKLKVAVTY